VANVYSSQFILYSESTPNTTYDVPEGFTAVIRQVAVTQDVGAYAFTLWIQNSDTAPSVAVIDVGGLGGGNNYQEECRFVVPEQGIISFGTTVVGSSLCCYVGGYLLRNVSPAGP